MCLIDHHLTPSEQLPYHLHRQQLASTRLSSQLVQLLEELLDLTCVRANARNANHSVATSLPRPTLVIRHTLNS